MTWYGVAWRASALAFLFLGQIVVGLWLAGGLGVAGVMVVFWSFAVWAVRREDRLP